MEEMMETKAPNLCTVYGMRLKAFVATQHRRYLKECIEADDDGPHNGLLVRELEVMERLVDRFSDTMEELREEKRI